MALPEPSMLYPRTRFDVVYCWPDLLDNAGGLVVQHGWQRRRQFAGQAMEVGIAHAYRLKDPLHR